jgi:hypothetical protein
VVQQLKRMKRLQNYILQTIILPMLSGYVLYGFEEIAQWHAESNSSVGRRHFLPAEACDRKQSVDIFYLSTPAGHSN